jgi:predicted ATPase
MTTNKRGSEWRKWDLHVHTPASDGTGTPEEIVNKAIEQGLSVIAITDHHSVDYIDQVKAVAKDKDLTVISGIEFRSEYGSKSVHFIAYFPDEYENTNLDSAALKDLILAPLGLSRTKIVAKGKEQDSSLSDDSAFKKGMFLVQVDFKAAADLIHKYGGIISVHNGSKENGLDKEVKHLGKAPKNAHSLYECLGTLKEELMKNYVDICDIEKEGDDEEFYLNTFSKPSILTSDAHRFEDIGSRYTWIKADSTFEGLKQILYEPESRVRIQELCPDNKADYQVIDTITLNEPSFWEGEICLNPYLNTIIGGRSTGKSTLLQCIAKKLGQPLKNGDEPNKSQFINEHYDTISIKWKDGETDTQREIMFFPQNYMIDLATNQQELNKLLEKIVKEKDDQLLLAKYTRFLGQNQITISSQVNQLFLEQSKINTQIALKKQKGDEKGIESEISKIQEKIERIESDSHISEDEIKKYNELATSIAQKQGEIKTIENDIRILDGIIPENLFNIYYKNELDSLSEGERIKLTTKLEEIKRVALENWKNELSQEKASLQNTKQQKVQEIETIQATEEYKKGYEYFQKNKEYKELQEQLKNEVEKLSSIKEMDKIIQQLQTNRDILKQNILDNHYEYTGKLNDLMSNLSFEFSNVSISLKSSVKEEQLKAFLQERHNLRGYERQGYIDSFVKEYKEGHVKEATQKYLDDALSNELDYKGGYVTNNVTSELLFTNWYDITYHLEYDNDSFDNMSQGKKSFVILKLLLDFSDKKCPILLDQPEDSLDNRAIYNELVEYLRKKKLDRQLIIVTHNSNVVVSADSENVIVANQNGSENQNRDGQKFQYINGALENTKPKNEDEVFILESQGIREHVCEILEGGVEAFKKREQKYGI